MNKLSRSYFWTIQIIAWILLGAGNILIQHSLHAPLIIVILNTTGLSLLGFVITSVFRWYLKFKINWRTFNRAKLISFVFLSTSVAACAWFILTILLFLPVFNQFHLSVLRLLPNIINFYILILVWTLLYLGFHLIKHYHIAEVEKWQLEAEIQKAKLGSLRSQINPHFMFNTLNNIRGLILEDPTAARHMISRFGDLLRYSLQYSELKEVTVEEELNILNQYIELVKIQYEEKIDFKIIINADLLSKTIPPMILQLLVENAIKHGIAVSDTGGEIIIEIKYFNKILSLQVKNTGTLIANPKLENSLGVGLKNIEERLRLLYGNNASLSISEVPPLVIVEVKIQEL